MEQTIFLNCNLGGIASFISVDIFPHFSFIFSTGRRSIATFRSTTDRIYDGGPIRLYFNNILYHNITQGPPANRAIFKC